MTMCAIFLVGLATLPFAPETKGQAVAGVRAGGWGPGWGAESNYDVESQSPAPSPQPHRVVIVGGGFGGLTRRRRLRRVAGRDHADRPAQFSSVSAAVVPGGDRRLVAGEYRGAAAVDSRAAGELRGAAGRGARLRRGAAAVCCSADGEIAVRHADRRRRRAAQLLRPPEWEPFAPGLKTIEDATEIRRRVLTAFEQAERETDDDRRRELLTFVIVGGGPTGVELAGTLAEIARHALKHEFRHIDPSEAQIVLVEAGDRVLPAYPPDLSAEGAAVARAAGRHRADADTMVTAVAPRACDARDWAATTERLPTHTVLWAAGVQASPLAQKLAAATGAALDRAGRISVRAGFVAARPSGDFRARRHGELSRIRTASRCRALRRWRFSRASSWRG